VAIVIVMANAMVFSSASIEGSHKDILATLIVLILVIMILVSVWNSIKILWLKLRSQAPPENLNSGNKESIHALKARLLEDKNLLREYIHVVKTENKQRQI
jgi:hypothetical protein